MKQRSTDRGLPGRTLNWTLAALLTGSSLALVAGCASSTGVPEAQAATAPGLQIGERAPDATITTADGTTVSLASLYRQGPIIVTFYRGGWCPYCNRALAGWETRMDEVRAEGARFIAISPESPEKVAATSAKANASYSIYSDTAHEASRKFRVHFKVDDETRTKYENSYDIHVDLFNASGRWELPAPATFLIDRQGVVRWAFAEWDYTKRADIDEVLAAVRAL